MRGDKLRRGITTLVCGAALLVTSQPAAAALSCVYDPGTQTVLLDLSVGLPAPSDHDWRTHRLETAPGGELRWSSWGSWGPNMLDMPCGGATVDNTALTAIHGNDTGRESLYFGDFTETQIVFRTDLAGAPPSTGDEVEVAGSTAGDTITVGEAGIALDALGTLITLESEVVKIVVAGGEGGDTISGQGGLGTGPPTSVALGIQGGAGRDKISGGLGVDRLTGDAEADELDGDRGDDWLIGGGGADVLTGGAGQDKLQGNARGDTFFARDGEADTVDGAAGSDRAQVDDGLDVVKRVEQLF